MPSSAKSPHSTSLVLRTEMLKRYISQYFTSVEDVDPDVVEAALRGIESLGRPDPDRQPAARVRRAV